MNDPLKYYRDLKNSLDTAWQEGNEEGLKKVALKMLRAGNSIEDIAMYTGLSEEQINKLKNQDGNS